MSVIYFLVALVLIQAVPFLRDLLNLPLHNGRSYYLDIYLLLLSISIILLGKTTKTKYNEHELKADPDLVISLRKIINYITQLINKALGLITHIRFEKIHFIWILPLIFILLSSRANNSILYFYLKQYATFFLLSYIIYIAVKNQKEHALYRTIYYVCAGYVTLLFIFFIANFFTGGMFTDITQKNTLPLLLLVMSELSYQANLKRLSRKFNWLGFISATIASAKLFFLMIIALYIIRKIEKRIDKRFFLRLLRSNYFYLIILSPFYLPFLFFFLFEIDMDFITSLGESRYDVNDNLASLISRVYSVYYMLTLEHLFSFWGFGEGTVNDIQFWGYPVHNLILSLFYSHGLMVGGSLLIVLISLRSWARQHMGLGLILSLSIIYINDIYPYLALFFIPYFQKVSTQKNNRLQNTQPLFTQNKNFLKVM